MGLSTYLWNHFSLLEAQCTLHHTRATYEPRHILQLGREEETKKNWMFPPSPNLCHCSEIPGNINLSSAERVAPWEMTYCTQNLFQILAKLLHVIKKKPERNSKVRALYTATIFLLHISLNILFYLSPFFFFPFPGMAYVLPILFPKSFSPWTYCQKALLNVLFHAGTVRDTTRRKSP